MLKLFELYSRWVPLLISKVHRVFQKHHKDIKKWNCFRETGLNPNLIVSIVRTATSFTKIISRKNKFHVPKRKMLISFLGEGGGVLGLIFAGYVPLASHGPYPIAVYSMANYRPHLKSSLLGTYLINPVLVKWIDPFLKWMNNTLLFTYSTNILISLLTVNMKNFLTPKIRKRATPF